MRQSPHSDTCINSASFIERTKTVRRCLLNLEQFPLFRSRGIVDFSLGSQGRA